MKALFLDRDGVVIKYIPYLSQAEQVHISQGAKEALKTWQTQGYKLVIVTNQSGISRGYFNYDDVIAIHQKILDEYGQFGVKFEDILLCPHQPADNCPCRKPSPYLLLNYSQKHNIDLSRSYFIGDAPSDIECAINANCQPVLVLTGRGEETKSKLSKYPISIPIFNSLCETVELAIMGNEE
ncbi:HAD-IIIA family hydrolase [Geminocystis sp. NIES-3709]|uniref:D-glycero-alpha-D-manno-heptose-1,7-bisphosphate 7-phosphatase n=1 Tax=Geminocystis sp. NIES-3709 TaxID=1617448 RepID=UPI0005FCD87A|nr:HAD family hydrolase [Geminocystis sp. NIES-3709]BAQ64622.1 D-glycero-D-manno-heptose 1,7-bisphosphate phosphatase [Geminocystis sp. NIES-3709]